SVKDPVVRRAYGTMTSIVGILLNLLLFAGKFTVGFLFSAVSIMADAFNNLSDAGAQLFSLVCFRIAAKPADREHPFGHARIEYLASVIVSLLVLLISYELLSESVTKFFAFEAGQTFSFLTVAVLAVSVGVKLWLSVFNRKIGKAIDSSVMRATAVDSLSDAAATGAVLIAVIVEAFVDLPFSLDAVMGVIVSVLVAVAGIRILLEAKNAILGEGPTEEILRLIDETVKGHGEALGIHDMLIHNYGPGKVFASFHIEVDGSADIFHTHDVIDNIERELRNSGIEATIHMDPVVTDDERVNALRSRVDAIVRSIDPTLRIHDFRFVAGTSHTNLIFDVLAPFEVRRSDEELRQMIADAVRLEWPDHYAVIEVDRG
ncbi:MAG: cation transporter, partial [Clostridia bacterium]|nr:cation transporter [Clostridia bacterium]